MTVTFRPATRQNTPLIVGIAGPTKSGKTYSALRVAAGLAEGRGPVVMLNAEGERGHQYADRFTYITADLKPPFRPARYTEALMAALAHDPKPGCVIIDSGSHMHDGPGGMLEYHESELDRLAANKTGRQRDAYNFTAWIRPKHEENAFIYAMLGADVPIILCLRAKEKIKIVSGKPPEDLGWRPIVGERVAFETIFTLVLPPHSKGVPDLAISEMREPFDTLIENGRQLDEETGRALAKWAAGSGSAGATRAADGRSGATAAAATSPEGSHSTPTPRGEGTDAPQPLTLERFHHQCSAHFIGPTAGAEQLARLFPCVESSAALTDEQRGQLFAALLDAKEHEPQDEPAQETLV